MSLLETYRQEIRVELPNHLDRDEWRFTRYGLLNAVQEMTASPESIITAEMKEVAKNSEGRKMEVDVYKLNEDVNVTNVRSCNIGTLDNTTDNVEVTWVTLVADIHMESAKYKINRVGYLEDLSRKLRRVDNAFAKAVEDLIDTKLNTEASTTYDSPLIGDEYQVSGGAIQVPKAVQETFFNDMEVIMNGDDFYSPVFKVLGNTPLKSPVRDFFYQGNANHKNLNYQFDAFDYRFSNHLSQGGDVTATGYVMPDGTVGLLTRIAIDSLLGHKTTKGTEWSTTHFDTLGAEVGVQYYSECADLSAVDDGKLAHLEASKVERWQFSFDVAIVTPYNSGERPGAIKKFEFVKDEVE